MDEEYYRQIQIRAAEDYLQLVRNRIWSVRPFRYESSTNRLCEIYQAIHEGTSYAKLNFINSVRGYFNVFISNVRCLWARSQRR